MEKNSCDYKKHKILVVEDEEDILRLLVFNLEKEGYKVVSSSNGAEALGIAIDTPPDLVILDIMLPEIDGLEVCRRLRSNALTVNVPILMLSARKEEFDKVLGLELGADDYMEKPFSVRELVARVRAMLRRQEQSRQPAAELSVDEQILKAGPIIIYPERHRVTVNGETRNLTHKEFLLLELLMSNPGRVLTRELLLDKVWGYEVEVDTRTVDVHIRYLRQKIESDPANPNFIETVRGVGYRFRDH
ncbi:MAG: response regulator transcription factor [Bacillota bacterium]|nr:response regulator transcription factor [Bacillota bacterium]MDW7729409.1 response regulator transcription factor [Bacillota bacterium]